MSDQAALELLAPVKSLRFEPVPHKYFLEPDGVELPSVTTVLKETRLIDYSMIPQDVLEAASKRGTAVHLALQFFDEGDLDESSLSDEIRPYLEAYKTFLEQTGFVPAMIEQRVWSPTYRYAGTLDRTGTFPRADGGVDLVCLDFKTGIPMKGHPLQLAAYVACLPEPRKYRRMSLYLKPDVWTLVEFEAKNYREDLGVFLHALSCQHWRMANGM